MSFGSGDTTRRDALARVLCARVCDDRRSFWQLRRLDGVLGAIERDADGDPLRVYVAGASTPHELERADAVASALGAYGVVVTSTWTSSVRAAGAGNPPDASKEDRIAWSSTCLSQVIDSDVLLFLVPCASCSTLGAPWEAGVAWSHGKHLVCAGATKRSVFCATAVEFDGDLDAIAHIVAMARRRE